MFVKFILTMLVGLPRASFHKKALCEAEGSDLPTDGEMRRHWNGGKGLETGEG